MKKHKGKILIAIIAALTGVAVFYKQLFIYPGLRSHVTASMKDPGSTQFRNERLASNGWLCGEVNSKNTYGAYVGFKRFMSPSDERKGFYLEGSSYVFGKDADELREQTKVLIEKLDAKIEMIRTRNEMNEKNIKFENSLDTGNEESVNAFLFQGLWEEHCM